jgi:serine/threonine protein kinase
MGLDVRNGYQGDIPLTNYPDFSQQGYQVIRELGRNQQAGRTTYLAHRFKNNEKVVIKEFRFANASSDWSGLKAYEREIEILQQLNHDRIPHYIDCFETPTGFYMLQEYKNAPSLNLQHSFHPQEIKQIAVSVLEILVYLQQRVVPIIHRDIKPENLLVDEQLNAYLIDFGLAQRQGAKMTLSSFAVGTPGFMPPEEQFGYPLTQASDLYSLGATLICLLTHTRSVNIGDLIDSKQRFNFQKLVPLISPCFSSWLIKMVAFKRQHRYPNAAVALEALKPISVIGNPNFSQSCITAVKNRKKTLVLGLAAITTLAIAGGITLMNAQSAAMNQQVFETKEEQATAEKDK